MSGKRILAEWMPDDNFNIMDYRDLSSGSMEVIPPPYLLAFRFPQEVVAGGVSVDAVGWNTSGCGDKELFSRVVVSKNGTDVVYDGKFEPNMRFNQEARLTGKDEIRVSLFPACPAHMARVNAVSFLSPQQQAKDNTGDQLPNEESAPRLPQPPLFNDYWYLYATSVVMFLMLVLTCLFTLMRPQKIKP